MSADQVVPWPIMLDDVRHLEELGIETVWLADHYGWAPVPTLPILEQWTTLAALAGGTKRVRLGTLISNVAVRHPAMLAKQAATVDRISGGRLDLGLGPGFSEREHAWLGISFLSPRGRIDRLREAVEVVDGLLRDRHLSYHGTYYHLDDAPLVPAPVQQPRPPLVIAADGKRALRIAATYADTWVWWGGDSALRAREKPLEEIRERNRLLDEYCQAIGRDPGTLERAYAAGAAKGETPFVSRDAFQNFVGRYGEAGIQRFIFDWASAAVQYKEADVVAGIVAGREVLEAFAAQEMSVMQSHSKAYKGLITGKA
jgi:alkanesulfonate monooxygenase SsuD/methylene tetrahydromethanopterin reductase-like flavin-dependent oxidoreductase (luciferase family)